MPRAQTNLRPARSQITAELHGTGNKNHSPSELRWTDDRVDPETRPERQSLYETLHFFMYWMVGGTGNGPLRAKVALASSSEELPPSVQMLRVHPRHTKSIVWPTRVNPFPYHKTDSIVLSGSRHQGSGRVNQCQRFGNRFVVGFSFQFLSHL